VIMGTNRFHVHGLRVSACRFVTRQKAFSGVCPSFPHRHGEAEPLWFGGEVRSMAPRGDVMMDSASGGIGIRLGRASGRRWERQRSTRFGEGSSRTQKVRGGSASSALEMASVLEVRRNVIGRS